MMILGGSLAKNSTLQKMANITSKSSIHNKPKFIGYLILFCIPFALIIFGINKLKSSSNSNEEKTEQNRTLFYKQEHLLTYNEWKNIADLRSKEYLECNKNLDNSAYGIYQQDYCARVYTNNWVLFRDGLDYKANLTDKQIDELREYWHKTRERAIDELKRIKIEEDKRKRPNRYK